VSMVMSVAMCWRRRPGIRHIAITMPAAAVVALSLSSTGPAHADTAPPVGTPATVSADPLPTWQVNGVVWSAVTVGNTVYATGSFTKARPPGTSQGSAQEVSRENLLAFDITTGTLLPFNHSLNAQGRRIVAAPDGSRIYVGGDFTSVDGVTRSHVAAFDTATGQLDSSFAPSISNTVRAIAVSSSTVYLGGNFFRAGTSTRSRLAAVSRSDGAVLPWAPATDDEVHALALSPDQSRVIAGGRFQTLNGEEHVGIGALDPASGTSLPWASRPIPTKADDTHFSYVTDLVVNGTTLYGAADGEGGHWFDGRFAANVNTGDLVWLDNCYGATYGLHVAGSVLYSVSHAHDCSSLGAFPQNATAWHRALAETTYATGNDPAPPGEGSHYAAQPIPTLLHWFPSLSPGTYTGQAQAAWAVTGTNQYLAVLGEFPRVNGAPQQGMTRFALRASAPNKVGPLNLDSLIPMVTSSTRGIARVSWESTWDYDNAQLTYEVLRDGSSQPVFTVTRRNNFWTVPTLVFFDTGLSPGSYHSYRIKVTDPVGNTVTSASSPSVQIRTTRSIIPPPTRLEPTPRTIPGSVTSTP